MFGLQLPLTCKPCTTLSNPCNKVRGKYFIKKSSCVCLYPPSLSLRASVIHCVSMYPAWTCRWAYNNLAMAWIGNKKAYDMVLRSRIINSLKMYKISHEVINFIDKTMKTWRVELTAGGRSFTETKIQRGIFQGDTLSPLLFIIAMMPLTTYPEMHSPIQT